MTIDYESDRLKKMTADVLITTDMSWHDIVEELCDNSNDANELWEATASLRDKMYGEEQN